MHYTEDFVVKAMTDVVSYADNTGCDGDLTVTSQSRIERLRQVLEIVTAQNARLRDLKWLTRQAIDSQNACNPRPISVMFSNAVFAVMADSGNPGYEDSPLCRVFLNTLLNIMKYRSLPHYNEEAMLYNRDMDALEALVKEPEPVAERKHIDCPCWVTGVFKQVPCPHHDGMGAYPLGAYQSSLLGQESDV